MPKMPHPFEPNEVPNSGVFFVCPNCRGRAVGISVLKRVGSKESIQRLWQRVRKGDERDRRVLSRLSPADAGDTADREQAHAATGCLYWL